MKCTAIEPLPTAAPTRLTESTRTSPAAKMPGHARFEQEGIASGLPSRRRASALDERAAREQEAVLVALDHVAQPFRAWRRTDEHEQAACRNGLRETGLQVAQRDLREMAFAGHALDFRMQPHVDVLGLVNLLDEIVRHARAQRRAAAKDGDRARVLGQKHRALSGRIGPAHNKEILVRAGHRLHQCRAVIHARARELLHAARFQLAIRHAARDHQRETAHFRSVGELDLYGASIRSPTACCVRIISAPKRRACASARLDRSAPLTPDGKPR